MRTMVTGIAPMVVITAAGITGKAMAINTGTSTTVIDPEGMVGVTRTMAGGGTADAETGSLPRRLPLSQNKQATSSGGLFVGGSGYLGWKTQGDSGPCPLFTPLSMPLDVLPAWFPAR